MCNLSAGIDSGFIAANVAIAPENKDWVPYKSFLILDLLYKTNVVGSIIRETGIIAPHSKSMFNINGDFF